MSTPSPSMRDLACKLAAATPLGSGSDTQETVLINEHLRLSLTRVAGADGFASLLRRSLALASATLPALRGAKVGTDGRIEGLGRGFAQGDDSSREAAVVVTAQLLELLVTFIGEPLTRKLVREAVPETSSDE